MKNLIFAALCCIAMSVNAASYFTAGDTVRINPNKLDGYQPIEFYCQFDAYVDCWHLDMEYPKGITTKLVSGITALEGMTITYFDRRGNVVTQECPLQVSAEYATIGSQTSGDGYWLVPNDEGEEQDYIGYEWYGSVKWEPGHHRMFMMNFYVSPDFRKGNIKINGHLTSGTDRRGPVLSDYRFTKKTYLWVGYRKGDVSGNETIDIGDVTLLIDLVLGHKVELDEFQLAAADMNCDGRVDIDDVTAIIDKNLGK